SGEQTLYKIKVYRPVNKSNATRITFALPETSDVILEEKKSTQKKEYQKKVDGLLYQVTEISIPLFALKSGHWELPPASVTYFVKDPNRRRRRRSFFDSFFDDDLFGGRGKKKQSWSKSLKIEVQEIDAIKPQSFSGLIGQFKIEQILSQTEITSDENITLKLKVTGIGSLSDLIEIPVSLDAFKIYPDGEGDLQERKSQEGLLGGIKEFSYALVPKNAGEQKIGPFELTYYDPQRETFVTVKTQEQLVTITQGSVKAPSSIYSTLTSDQMMEAKNNTKKKVQVLKHNILPLEMDYDIRSKFFLSRNHMVVLSLLLIFFTILYELFLKKRFSFKKSGVELEYSYAMSVFNREIESELSAAKVFSDFVLRKLKIPLVEKTPEQTLEILKNKGIDTVLYDDLNQLYQREEMNRYSGRISNQLDNSQWKKLSKLIQDLF
ncbi:BatD family protein, partial [bacterium]|nr:BatD family protein [bacterium]